MKTFQFKTNIKCSGCVATVTPELNNAAGVNNWQVDVKSPEKILTISGDGINESDIEAAVIKAGYKAERIG